MTNYQPFPQGQYPYPGQPPQQPRKPQGRKRALIAIASLLGLFVVALTASLAGNSKTHHAAPLTKRVKSLRHEHVASPDPVDTPAAVNLVRTTEKILFVVKGSGAADITYGSDSDNNDAGTVYSLPWHGTVTYDKSALYYAVNAQLNGAGSIRCYAYAQVTGYYSNHTHHVVRKLLAKGHASGGYSICMAEST